MKTTSSQQGFALLMAVIVTATLLLVSFALSEISFKELLLSSTGRDSQIAFYAADTGVECALFWDIKNPDNPDGKSAFDPLTPSTIHCNGNDITGDGAGSPSVPTVPDYTAAVVGGGQLLNPPTATSTFMIFLGPGYELSGPCAIVRVGKSQDPMDAEKTVTTIFSRGYNTCDTENGRRLERALRVIY